MLAEARSGLHRRLMIDYIFPHLLLLPEHQVSARWEEQNLAPESEKGDARSSVSGDVHQTMN